ncbi:hypothetical protein L208DRAFT_805703 [Tricholoma matsutake]|nr:hypothetical protein L208DRAFT_805703 [Tricholoma matsutake 945]
MFEHVARQQQWQLYVPLDCLVSYASYVLITGVISSRQISDPASMYRITKRNQDVCRNRRITWKLTHNDCSAPSVGCVNVGELISSNTKLRRPSSINLLPKGRAVRDLDICRQIVHNSQQFLALHVRTFFVPQHQICKRVESFQRNRKHFKSFKDSRCGSVICNRHSIAVRGRLRISGCETS